MAMLNYQRVCYFWMYVVVLHMVSWVDNATAEMFHHRNGIHWDRQIPPPHGPQNE